MGQLPKRSSRQDALTDVQHGIFRSLSDLDLA